MQIYQKCMVKGRDIQKYESYVSYVRNEAET